MLDVYCGGSNSRMFVVECLMYNVVVVTVGCLIVKCLMYTVVVVTVGCLIVKCLMYTVVVVTVGCLILCFECFGEVYCAYIYMICTCILARIRIYHSKCLSNRCRCCYWTYIFGFVTGILCVWVDKCREVGVVSDPGAPRLYCQ